MGLAQRYFKSLGPRSVRKLFDLGNLFIGRFITSVLVGRKPSYLEIVKKRRNESLRGYMARFNSKALQIPDLDEVRSIKAMQCGMTSLEFFGSLCRKPLSTLSTNEKG